MKRSAIDLSEDTSALIDDWARAEVAAIRARPRVPRRLSDAQWDYEQAIEHDWTWR